MVKIFFFRFLYKCISDADSFLHERSKNASDIEDAEFFYEYMRDAPENKLKYFREKGTELNIEPDKVRNRLNRIQRKLAKGISKEAKEDFWVVKAEKAFFMV